MNQSNHTGPYKRITFPNNGQRGKCDFGRKAQKEVIFLALKMEGRRHESKNVSIHKKLERTRKQSPLKPKECNIALPYLDLSPVGAPGFWTYRTMRLKKQKKSCCFQTLSLW